MKNKRVIIGSDHAGYALKEQIKQYLLSKQIEVTDCGVEKLKRTDYPIFGKKVASIVSKDSELKGIVICGTGIGICKSANLTKNVRCIVGVDARLINQQVTDWNINVLALGARTTTFEIAQEIIDAYLSANFLDYDHQSYLQLLN